MQSATRGEKKKYAKRIIIIIIVKEERERERSSKKKKLEASQRAGKDGALGITYPPLPVHQFILFHVG